MAQGEAQAKFKISADSSDFSSAIDVSIKKVRELSSETTKAATDTARALAQQAVAARQDVAAKEAAVQAAREANRLVADSGKVAAKATLDGAREALRQAREILRETQNEARKAETIARQQQQFDVQQALTRTRLSQGSAAETELKASLAGFSPDAAKQYRTEIEKATQANTKFALSARASGYALSLIPAQMTDVVTQLAGGQSPFLILVQQGGQLKDMFGGVGPAIRAVSGYLSALITPTTAAAAAFAALGYAYVRSTQQLEDVNTTLILTGNSAGLTADAVLSMGQRIGQSAGTTGQAVDALLELTKAGRFTASDLETVGASVVAFSRATGAALEDVAKEFASIAKDPIKGLEEANQKYNFLTATVYRQVAALIEQGKQQEAVSLALNAFSQATDRMSSEVNANLGVLTQSWRGLKLIVSGAADAIQGVFQPKGMVELLQDLESVQRQINKLNTSGKPAAETEGQLLGFMRQRAEIERQLSEQNTVNVEKGQRAIQQDLDNKKIAASAASRILADSVRTNQQILQSEIDKRRELLRKGIIDQDQYAQDVRNLATKYKEPEGKAVTDDAAVRMLQQLREREASIRAQLVTSDKLTETEKKSVEFNQLIADLKTKTILTADQKSLLLNQDSIRTQLGITESLEKELKLKEDIQKVETRGAQISKDIAASMVTREEQYKNQLDAATMGKQAFDRAKEEALLRKEFQKYQIELSKDLSKGAIGSDKFADEQEKIKQGLQTSLGNFRDYYSKLDDLNSKWQTGASGALADYVADVGNVARSTYNLFNNALRGVEDAFVSMATTGSISFTDLANSIISDLARIVTRQTITGPIAAGLSSAMGSIFGGSSLPDTASWAMPELTAPGRAKGGPTAAGSLYRVNEQGPELYTTAGRTYLMAGGSDGFVTPVGQGMGGGQTSVEVNVINQSSQPMSAKKGGGRFDGAKFVQDIILSDLRRNGPIGQALKG